MPHPTVAAAEKAAIEGNIPEIDTQACEGIQEFLLSVCTSKQQGEEICRRLQAYDD